MFIEKNNFLSVIETKIRSSNSRLLDRPSSKINVFDKANSSINIVKKLETPRKLSPIKISSKLNLSPDIVRHRNSPRNVINDDSSKLKLQMCKPYDSNILPLEIKNKKQYLSTRKKNPKKLEFSALKSQTINKNKNDVFLNQSFIPGMQYWMFKREWLDDQILENFLSAHLLEFNQYNIMQMREFAENSFESPIDFTVLIKKLQKRNRRLKKEGTKDIEMMETIQEYWSKNRTNNNSLLNDRYNKYKSYSY